MTSQQSIWTELPQVGTKATPDTREGRKEMFYLTTHSTHFIYGYMASNIWLGPLTQEMEKRKEKKKEKKERDWTLPDVIAIANEIPAEPNDFGFHVMPWRCWSNFILPNTTMNEPKYVVLLKETLKLHMHIHRCTIFIQDGAPCHRSKVATAFLKKIRSLCWIGPGTA